MRAPLQLAALALGLAACSIQADFDGTRFRCDEGGHCPVGYDCVAGFCQAGAAADAAPSDDGGLPTAATGDVAFYSFDDYRPTNVVHDRSGHRYDGNPDFDSAIVAGRYGDAITLDGADDNVKIAGYAGIHLVPPYTVEAWIRPNAVDADQPIVGDYDGASAEVSWQLELTAGGGLRFLSNDDGVVVSVETATGLVASAAWTHVALAWDGQTAGFFVDAIEVARPKLVASPIVVTAREIRIGRHDDEIAGFAGLIDEVKLTSRAVGAAELAASRMLDSTTLIGRCGDHLVEGAECEGGACCDPTSCQAAERSCAGTCTAGLCELPGARSDDGLVARYLFDEGAGTVVNDASASGLDLTIENGNFAWGSGYLALTGANRLLSPASLALANACLAANELTIAAWVVPPSLDQPEDATLVAIGDAQDEAAFLRHSKQAFSAFVDAPQARDVLIDTPPGDARLGLTQVAVVRHLDGRRQVFVDGRLRGETDNLPGALESWSATTQIAVGNEVARDAEWLGQLHLVEIYCRALTGDEIAASFAAGADP